MKKYKKIIWIVIITILLITFTWGTMIAIDTSLVNKMREPFFARRDSDKDGKTYYRGLGYKIYGIHYKDNGYEQDGMIYEGTLEWTKLYLFK